MSNRYPSRWFSFPIDKNFNKLILPDPTSDLKYLKKKGFILYKSYVLLPSNWRIRIEDSRKSGNEMD